MDEMLNWLWQGGVVAAAAALLLALTGASARVRYTVWCGALALVLMLPMAHLPLQVAAVPGVSEPLPEPQSIEPPAASVVVLPDRWWTSNEVAIGMWGGWVVVHTGQLLMALLALRRTKRHCHSLAPGIEERLALWGRLRSSGRRARLMLSSSVSAAAVLGGRSPVVALSPVVIEELRPAEIDAIVTHEWAHVQRRDDLAALAQAVVRVLAGWHPAVWWLDRQINRDREHACDEQVLELTGAAKSYAACLVKLAGLPVGPMRPLPVVTMSGSGLRHRVMHVLAWHSCRPRPRRWVSIATAAVLIPLAISVAGIELVGFASASPSATPAEIAPAAVRNPLTMDAPARPATIADAIPAASTAGAAVTLRQAAPVRSSSDRAAIETAPSEPARQVLTPPAEPPVDSRAVAADSPEVRDVTARPLAPLEASMPALREGLSPRPAATAVTAAASAEPTPWSAAADAGVAIGRGSQKAAVKTAGFFTRVSRKIASSF